MPEQPNILFLLTDQQSATMLSCAGNPYVRTPAMDSLAASGVRFARAYCTNPVCVPSRYSLVTGRMPNTIGMISNNLTTVTPVPDSVKHHALGHLMRRAGYDVAYGGKVHLPRLTAQDAGFDVISGDQRDLLPEHGAAFIRQKRDKPFFLMASFINPHDICYMAIRDFIETDAEQSLMRRSQVECATLDAALQRPDVATDEFFKTRCPPLPPNFEPQAGEPEAIRVLIGRRPFREKARALWSEERWREHRWAYLRLTEFVDAQIGRLLKALRDSGQADNTLIVLTSDHGEMDAAHRLEGKSTLHEEVCRIPLVLCPPGGAAAARVDEQHVVSNGLDLLPTLCDYAGVTPPPDLPGCSLRPLVESELAQFDRQTVPVESAIGQAVISRRFKYATYDVGQNGTQLTDLATDPGEMRNALQDAPHRDTVESMRQAHAQWFAGVHRRPEDVIAAAANA